MPTRQFLRIGLAAAAAMVLIPVSATHSAAATCTPDHLCLYQDGVRGPMGSFVTGTDDTGRVGLPGGGYQADNRTTQDWCLWSKTDYEGKKTVVKPGDSVRLPFAAHSLLPENTWRCMT
ncbi:peptidase inhibitor family I36 protein [Streptomyces sp. NPDC059718]